MDDYTPDYAKCSLRDLYDVQARINRAKYPQRYALLLAEIERREESGEVEISAKQDKRASHAVRVRLISALFFTVGVYILFFVVIDSAMFTLESKDWPATPCVVSHPQTGKSSPHVTYKYQVRGTTYFGERLSSSDSARKPGDWVKEFPNGMKTKCFFNPDNPGDATLTRGWGFGFFFGMVWSVFAIWAGIFTFRNPQETTINGYKPD